MILLVLKQEQAGISLVIEVAYPCCMEEAGALRHDAGPGRTLVRDCASRADVRGSW